MALRVEISYGTGDYYQDGAFGSIDPPEWEPVDSVEDAIDVVRAAIEYKDISSADEFTGGEVKDGETLVATIEVKPSDNGFDITHTHIAPDTPTSKPKF